VEEGRPVLVLEWSQKGAPSAFETVLASLDSLLLKDQGLSLRVWERGSLFLIGAGRFRLEEVFYLALI
jgi:hypothetical protein